MATGSEGVEDRGVAPDGRGLHRTLGAVSSIAIAFSAAGVSAGVYSLFGFSLAMSGGAFIWGWLLVGLGTFFLCLIWAELASHYPLAGVMYQWPRRLTNRGVAWGIGWLYLFAMMYVLCGVYFILPAVLLPLFEIESTTAARLIVAGVALVVAAGVNVLQIERFGKLTVLATIAELVLIFGITLATLVGGAHQSLSVFTEGAEPGQSFSAWLPGFVGGGVFIGLWVMQSFEVGGTIGEETKEAHRQAPRSILSGWGASFVVGLFMIFSLVIAIPDMATIGESESPVLTIVESALAGWVGKLYLALLAVVIIVGANVVFTMVTRQMYGMARARMLPFSKQLMRTHPRTGEPWVAVLATALITAIPFIFSDEFTVLATGSTAVLYLVYFLMASVCLIARLRGWPKADSPFRLGRWGLVVNVLAVLYTGAAALDLMWFRETTNPDWKLGIPTAIWLLAVPVVLGALYWAFAGRRSSQEPVFEEVMVEDPAAATG